MKMADNERNVELLEAFHCNFSSHEAQLWQRNRAMSRAVVSRNVLILK